jgi:hypothetical protein
VESSGQLDFAAEKEIATEEGVTLEELLIRAIQAVQARARQKHGVKSNALATTRSSACHALPTS